MGNCPILSDYRLTQSTGATAKTYSHDTHGTRTFVYNQNNRLIYAEEGATVLGQYFYDAFGRRVKKTASGVTTVYHYDIAGNLIAETRADGTPLRDIVYQNGERVSMKLFGSQAGWYYFVNDHLGTPQKIVDSSGAVVWAGFYLPFGKAWAYPATITNNFRFPGQYYDIETGLHYNWHRYYDPDTGRYITADPIGLEGGVNLYVYVMGNPANVIDSTGLAGEDVLKAIAWSIAFAEPTPIGEALMSGLTIIIISVGIAETVVLMTAPGRNADSGIEKMVRDMQSAEVLKGNKRPDKCEVLKELIANGTYTKKQAKSTLKAWNCPEGGHSRHSKDKCKK